MSVSAANLLTRLDELKKWQEQQQKRLQLQNRRRLDSTDSDYNTIQGLSAFDSSQDKSETTVNCNYSTSTAPRQFPQSPANETYKSPPINKPKKPFLRRGSGLSRFGMNPGDQKRPFNKTVFRNNNQKKVVLDGDKNNITEEECSVGYKAVALDAPECNIKARWCTVDNQIITKQPIEEDCGNKQVDLIAQINKFASMQTISSESSSLTNSKKPNTIDVDALVHENSQEDIMYVPSEQSLDKELLIFEALEQKVLHSSFSSTNSSIVRLLSSTPNKKKPDNSENPQLREDESEVQTITKKSVHFESSDRNALMQLLQQFQPTSNVSVDVISLHSSINSEDLEEETATNFDFKDTECWSDTNASNSANSSLIESLPSSVSVASSSAPKTVVDKATNFPEDVGQKFEEDSLASKLQQLEQDLKNCKIERRKLEKIKAEIEKEQREFMKEKKAFEKYVLDEKIKTEFYLEDEKKKLAKEKMIFERYVKEVNNKTTRKEREEISALKSELSNVKEAAKLKETRNATSQARLRNQIKTLEKENANLKDEVETLLKQNAKLQAAQKFSNRKVTETKMLHEINKNLSKLAKDVKVTEQLNKIDVINKKLTNSCEKELHENKSKSDDSLCDYSRVTRPYGDYLQEAKINNKIASNDVNKKLLTSSCEEELHEDSDYSRVMNYDNYLQEKEKIKQLSPANYKENDCNSINQDNLKSLTDCSLIRNYEKMFGGGDGQQTVTPNDKKSRSEVILSDGSSEVSYSNGNKKVVSPDGNFIVMKYFNGDVKETRLLEGVIRYYYAENQSWHTTFADGSELLEFSNGQTERKLKDGKSEITFPNGVVKKIAADGSEDISYPDGSKVSIDSHGQKILLLPNGQKEIHNEDHMRREYPDGTVKILYPDGIQETRYSNGRIRIKDKNGKLLLDSFDEDS